MIKNLFKQLIITLLKVEARLVVKKYKPKIIGVTGNAGKTGTKDAIAAVLAKNFYTWKNEKSYNSDFGLPLTILHCKNAWNNLFLWIKNLLEGVVLILFPHRYPEWLVLEIGADKPGDISQFTSWIKPEIVVVTRIGKVPVHIEFFSSREELIKEKGALVKALKPGGVLILNNDDLDVLAMRKFAPRSKVVTYGFGDGSLLRASNYHVFYKERGGMEVPDGLAFKIDYMGNIIPVRISGVVGRHNAYSLMAAFAVGLSLNLNFVTMMDSVVSYERPPGRLRLIDGIKNSIILDDTYNSSPAAAELSLESFNDIKTTGRKIIALGDMLELGQHTADAHFKIGQLVGTSGSDFLFTVGQRALSILDGATKSGMSENKVMSFGDSRALGEYLKGFIGPGDVILLKGSQGMRMERAVEMIMNNREEKSKLLARQDEAWIKR